MLHFPHRLFSATCLAIIIALGSGFTSANSQQIAQTNQPTIAPADVDEATLDAFAQAFVDVQAIINEWQPQVEAAENEESAQQIRDSANQEMREAVQSSGLETQTYNQLLQLAQTNPEFAAEVREKIEVVE
jgi:thiamine pyrophosphate-dependent acetolactate synthase large subunit-like protein